MRGDRELSLFRQACLAGLIDPRGARLLDRRWFRKARWALEEVERRHYVDYHRMEHAAHCGAMNYLAGSAFDVHWKQALEVQSLVRRELLPWVKVLDRADHARRMSAEWERQWGDINDPETKKRIRETIEAMHRKAREGREKNPLGRR